LLEAEGVLERNRGKPMTIARIARAQSPLAKRLLQLEPHLEQLVLAARQLELGEAEVARALRNIWEKTDERSLRRRTPAR
jgi:GntR family transcriptional regulator